MSHDTAQSQVDYERRCELADTIIDALEEMPATDVALLADALVLSDGRLGGFGQALRYFSNGSLMLTRFKLSDALLLLTLPLDQELLDRLELAEAPVWRALHRALVEVV